MSKNIFSDWSKKLGVSVKDLEAEYDALLKDEQNIHPNLTKEQIDSRALSRLYNKYRRGLSSRASHFTGVNLGDSGLVDLIEIKKRFAKKIFETNAENAIVQGLTNAKGIPLDTREKVRGKPNPSFGKPFSEDDKSFIRHIYGVVFIDNSTRFYKMTAFGEVAERLQVPLYQECTFRANDKTQSGVGDLELTAVSATKFTPTGKDIDMQSVFKSHHYVTIDKLDDYHEQHKADRNRITITEGDVITMNLEPNQVTGNRMILLGDSSLGFEDKFGRPVRGIVCWIPESLPIDFGEDSRVLVIGQTNRGRGYDYEAGEPTDEPGNIMMNVYGIWAIPEFKINLDLKPVTETDISIDLGDKENVGE